MADLINLNKVRKAKKKQDEKSKAEENRIVYGISTTVRKQEKLRQKRDAQKLGQKRLTTEADNKKG
ncbi:MULTISPECIES: DUF4169 family protein [Asticcacaulis]|uniref:DUF4169 domain-containing protein n=1 Tax=Asticcacaulis taihuensis TaxID=260084 RepID=A0A1G4QV54_9CAUL|nr:DUF4169 family protein [Asticcacaulis taihuensis]MCR6658326.1 DUF4169 family protein [Asticcacaulis sp.]SCW48520.1 protein of unknown function [Asticcacaulis taihuensis]